MCPTPRRAPRSNRPARPRRRVVRASPIPRNCSMPSTKKPASSKRASFPREASYEKRFVKDWELLSHSGRYNMNQLNEAMMLLIANYEPLAPDGLDNAFKAHYIDHSESQYRSLSLLNYTIEGQIV